MLDLARWVVDLPLSFAPHITLLAALLLGLSVVQRQWIGASLLLLLVLAAALIMLRSEQHLARAQDCGDDATLRVTTFNVYRKNGDPHALANVVASRDPDVLVLQELTGDLVRQLADVSDEYPHQLVAEPPSVAILSRLPFEDAHVIDVPGAPAERGVLSVRVSNRGETITIFSLHATGPGTPGGFRTRDAQFDRVRELVTAADGPVIVAGDLNATIFSRPFHALLNDAGLRTAISGRREAPTWPDWARPFGIRIDHVLVNGLDVCSVAVGPASGSDHRPVTADLRVPPSTGTGP